MDYIYSVEDISASMLQGFFVGWPNPPSPDKHLQLLKNSDYVVLAINEETGNVIGFITAISDRVLSAYIPFLEVLPDYQNRGIGKELVRRMIKQLNGIYMIDLMCDKDLQTFYEKFDFLKAEGMVLRNYNSQSGL